MKKIIFACSILTILISMSASSFGFVVQYSEETEATKSVSPGTTETTEESWFEILSKNATFEAKNPAYLLLNDTAYMNPKGFVSLTLDFAGKGYTDVVLGTGGDFGIFLIPGFSMNGDYFFTYGLKWRFFKENDTFPTMAIGLRGGASQNTKYGYDPFSGSTFEWGKEKENEISYKLLFSKGVGQRDHVHFGLEFFNGTAEDKNGNKESWNSYGISLGYDTLTGSFRPMTEIWYDPPQQFQKVSIAIRGPIEWWLQFQLGYLDLRDHKTSWSDNAIIFGFFMP